MQNLIKSLDEFEGDFARDSACIKFVHSMKDDTIEEIFTYTESLDHINNAEEDDLVEWKFKAITVQEGPLLRSHPNCNRSHTTLE